jgi:methionyl-tRNA formyltransferase
LEHPSPRIVLAGSVQSSQRVLRALIRHNANVAGVLALDRSHSSGVSGYVDLAGAAAELGLNHVAFTNINAREVTDVLRSWSPDVLFVVGLSQLVQRPGLELPRLGCVGFHPTWLPRGRGRAPLAWLTLEGVSGAASFFVLNEEPDGGALLAQEPFFVAADQYAEEVAETVFEAMDRALDRWLPQLMAGQWNPVPQDHRLATFYGRRAPEDGLVRWEKPAVEIHALIRAASRPHPGAYTFACGNELRIWRAELDSRSTYKGVVGRILDIDRQQNRLIQAGSGLLWLTEMEWAGAGAPDHLPRVGARLGYEPELEIHRLLRRIEVLEKKVSSR